MGGWATWWGSCHTQVPAEDARTHVTFESLGDRISLGSLSKLFGVPLASSRISPRRHTPSWRRPTSRGLALHTSGGDCGCCCWHHRWRSSAGTAVGLRSCAIPSGRARSTRMSATAVRACAGSAPIARGFVARRCWRSGGGMGRIGAAAEGSGRMGGGGMRGSFAAACLGTRCAGVKCGRDGWVDSGGGRLAAGEKPQQQEGGEEEGEKGREDRGVECAVSGGSGESSVRIVCGGSRGSGGSGRGS